MIASLPMYDWPEIRADHDIYWQAILAQLGSGPAALTRDTGDLLSHWQRPDLLLSQTCGMPLRTRLHGKVTLVGTPDYALPAPANDAVGDSATACPRGHYYSVLIMNAQDDRTQLSEFADDIFAYNDAGSQSGYAAPLTHASAQGLRLTRVYATGSHRASLQAVAAGRAALAAIDAVTWALALRHDPCTARLRVLGATAPTPALPYICARGHDPAPLHAAISRAIATLPDATRAALLLRGLCAIPLSAYLAVPNPPQPCT